MNRFSEFLLSIAAVILITSAVLLSPDIPNAGMYLPVERISLETPAPVVLLPTFVGL